jgi:hypothetical protein
MTPLTAPVSRSLAKPAPRPIVAQVGNAAKRKAAVMRWLRRIHLYSGLALLPWVLIYGISGFLFNHGGSTSTARELVVPPDQRAPLAPPSDELGARLLTAIGKHAPSPSTTLSGTWTFDFHDPESDKNYRLAMPIDGSGAFLTERRPRTSSSTNLPRDTFAAEKEQVARIAEATLASIGMEPENLRPVGGPSLRVVSDDTRWSASLTRDRVSESTTSSLDLGRLMRRLHVTHGYGRSDWSRVVWAVFVDIMAFAMVMWAITGLAMWWQKRSTRVAGAITLVAAFGGGTALIFALQAVFQS